MYSLSDISSSLYVFLIQSNNCIKVPNITGISFFISSLAIHDARNVFPTP